MALQTRKTKCREGLDFVHLELIDCCGSLLLWSHDS